MARGGPSQSAPHPPPPSVNFRPRSPVAATSAQTLLAPRPASPLVLCSRLPPARPCPGRRPCWVGPRDGSEALGKPKGEPKGAKAHLGGG